MDEKDKNSATENSQATRGQELLLEAKKQKPKKNDNNYDGRNGGEKTNSPKIRARTIQARSTHVLANITKNRDLNTDHIIIRTFLIASNTHGTEYVLLDVRSSFF